MMTAVALTFLTYVLSPMAVFLLLRGALRPAPQDWPVLALLSTAMTPALFGRLVVWELRLLPGKSDEFYLFMGFCAVGCLGVAGWMMTRQAVGSLSERLDWQVLRPSRLWSAALLFSVACGIAVIWSPDSVATWIAVKFADLYGTGTGLQKLFGAWGMGIVITLALLAIALLGVEHRAGSRSRFLGVERMQLWLSVLLAGALTAVVSVTVLVCLGGYLKETDALQHMKAALLIWEAKDVGIYPLVPAQADGSFATSSHPLGHHGSFIWNYMLQGEALPDLNKLPVLYAYLGTVGLIVLGFPGLSLPARLAAALVLSCTAGYVTQTVNAGIDAPRLFLLLSGCWFFARGLDVGRWPWFAVAGCVIGLAINTHSINLFFAFFCCATLALMYRAAPLRWLGHIGLVGLCAVIVGTDQYLANFLRWGQITYASQPLWDLMPEFDYAAWRAASVPVEQPVQRLINVALTGFTTWYLFDVSYWLAALAALVGWGHLRHDRAALAVSAAGIASALAFATLSLVSPTTGEFVFNYRYQMTGYPLLIVVMMGLFSLLLGGRTRTEAPHVGRAA